MRFNQHFRSFNEWKWCTIYDCHIFTVYEFLVVLLPLKKRKETKEEGLLGVYLILTFQLWCIKLETCQNIIFEKVGAPWNWAGWLCSCVKFVSYWLLSIRLYLLGKWYVYNISTTFLQQILSGRLLLVVIVGTKR